MIKIIKKKKNRNRNKDENKGNKIRKDNIFKQVKAHSIKFVINTINHILDKENINIFCRLNWNFLVRLWKNSKVNLENNQTTWEVNNENFKIIRDDIQNLDFFF